jgi:predicted transcriptional regulator
MPRERNPQARSNRIRAFIDANPGCKNKEIRRGLGLPDSEMRYVSKIMNYHKNGLDDGGTTPYNRSNEALPEQPTMNAVRIRDACINLIQIAGGKTAAMNALALYCASTNR